MSGGHYNYSYNNHEKVYAGSLAAAQGDLSELLKYCRTPSEYEAVAKSLAAAIAAHEELLRALEKWRQLEDVLIATEWWRSCDYSPEMAIEEIVKGAR